MMSILYFTYSTVYKKSLCQLFRIPMLIIVHNIIININNHYYKNVQMCLCYNCACVIKFHVARLMNTFMKMVSNSRSNR